MLTVGDEMDGMMGREEEKYWTVTLKVFAFDTKEKAHAYSKRLTDAFCDMPESEEYGSVCSVYEESTQ